MKITLTIILLSFTMSINLFAQQGWQFQNSNQTNNLYGAIYPINKDTVFVIADSGKFLKTYNGGTNWISQNTGFTVSFFDLSFCNNDTGYAVGQNGTIIRTIDGGTNWTSFTSGTDKNLFSIDTKTLNNLWVVGDSGIILNSLDYGATWIKNDTLTNKRLNSICFRNSNIGFIAGNTGALFRTVNGGQNWDTLNIATSLDLFSIAVTSNYAYLLGGYVNEYSFDSDELYKTNDNTNWTVTYFGAHMPGLSKLYFQNDSLGFTINSNCTTNSQCAIEINKTTDFGQNWMDSFHNWNPPSQVGHAYSDICFVNDEIGYALSGNNILKTTDGGIFVNVKELNNKINLNVNPNPFSLETTLKIDKCLEDASLTVFNSFGQVLKKMTNISGRTFTLYRDNLPSGVYFIRLIQSDKVVIADKIIITDNRND